MLPAVVSSISDCAITTRETTASSSSVVAVTGGLGNPTASGSNFVVIPTTISNDYEYLSWYVKYTADGGKTLFTGVKSLYVGCTSSVSIIQFTEDSIAYVGDTNLAVYQMMLPFVTRSYCSIILVEAINVQFDGVPTTTALV